MPTRLDRVAALRSERAAVLAFCEGLSTGQWCAPSAADGWSVQDVLAHMGSGCHAMFSPAALSLLTSDDIERTNDDFVAVRRSWTPAAVLDEYRTWSARVVTLATVVSRTPLGMVSVPLAELGRFRASLLLGGALVFDHHTHLRHDLLPAVGRAEEGTDANRLGVVLEWMMAVLANQLKATTPEWLDRPVVINLNGMGDGTWTFSPTGFSRGADARPAVYIDAATAEFPEWGTKRCDWRDRNVTIRGDHVLGTTFLDALNVV